MLKQLKYFQSVVRLNSFSEAAEENFISQSAISQQVQALERELGFLLLERKNRSFTLTPAGEYFYQKSLILTADYERMRSEAAKIARGNEDSLKIGYRRIAAEKAIGVADLLKIVPDFHSGRQRTVDMDAANIDQGAAVHLRNILIFHLLKLKLIQTPSLSLILSYLNLYALQHTGYERYAVSGPRRACFDPFIWAHRAISFRVLNVRVSSSA